MIGVMFGNKHSYRDFGLILSAKTISLPKPKTEFTNVPGADGSIDLSTVLTDGDIKYANRTITCKFTVIDPIKNWESVKSKVANYLHGQRMNIIFDVDKGYYYNGRCTIDPWAEKKRTGSLTVKIDADPYKYDVQDSTEDWIWDTFNFETGIIYDCTDIEVASGTVVSIPSKRMKLVPVITVDRNVDVTFKGVRYGLTIGDNRYVNIQFSEGDNVLTFHGPATVTISFRGGSL